MENARTKYLGAISIRNSEGEIQWNRFNAMLVVNTVFLTISISNFSNIPSFLLHKIGPVIGVILCYLWFKMTKNGFYWTKHWISEARRIEEHLPDSTNVNPLISGNDKRESRNEIINTAYAAYCIIGIIAGLYIVRFILS